MGMNWATIMTRKTTIDVDHIQQQATSNNESYWSYTIIIKHKKHHL